MVGDTIVGPGETLTLADGIFLVVGTIRVAGGGTLRVIDAKLLFTNESDGILVAQDGNLRVRGSDLVPAPLVTNGSARYRVEVAPGADFRLETTLVEAGQGVFSAANGTLVDRAVLRGHPHALTLSNATARITRSTFLDNPTHLRWNGGAPRVDNNTLLGGGTGMAFSSSAFRIEDNDLAGQAFGIVSRASTGTIRANSMEDDGDPYSIGALITGSTYTLFVGNTLTRWGTGLRAIDSNVEARDNTISNGVDGFAADGGTATIERNEASALTGTAIAATNVRPLTASGNDVHDNARHVRLSRVTGTVSGNRFADATSAGIVVSDVSGPLALTGNEITGAPGWAISVVDADGLSIAENRVHDVANGILLLDGAAQDVRENEIYATGTAIQATGAAAGAVRVHHNAVRDVTLGIVANAHGMRVDNNTITRASERGAWAYDGDDITIERNLIASPGVGIRVSNEGSPAERARLTENVVTGATGVGIELYAPAPRLARNEVAGGSLHGVWASGMADDATFDGDFIHHTGGSGLVLRDVERANVTRVRSLSNAHTGFPADGGGSHEFYECDASGNLAGNGFSFGVSSGTGAVTRANRISHSRAEDNGGAGLATWGDTTTTWRVTFSGNGIGVDNPHATESVTTEHAWWGSATGPTAPGNPGGSGDLAQGLVDFTPWLTTAP